MTAQMTEFAGIKARKMKPTLQHRPAMWECILGTVYAMNEDREVKYFDYDWEAAAEFAGVSEDRDLRLYRKQRRVSYTKTGYDNPRYNQMVLWVLEA